MRSLLTFGLLALALCACSSPKTSYYTLSGVPAPSVPATNNQVRVMVGPVTLPEMIDQPLLVVQNSSNQVNLYEYHRWAGSLKGDVGRVIAIDLARELGTPNVWNFAQTTQTQYDYQVLIDVQSLDSKLGESVVLDVLWTIKPTASKSVDAAPGNGKNTAVLVTKGKPEANAVSNTPANTPPKPRNITGHTLVREPVAGTGLDAMVAAQSRAFMKVSSDIAKAIQ